MSGSPKGSTQKANGPSSIFRLSEQLTASPHGIPLMLLDRCSGVYVWRAAGFLTKWTMSGNVYALSGRKSIKTELPRIVVPTVDVSKAEGASMQLSLKSVSTSPSKILSLSSFFFDAYRGSPRYPTWGSCAGWGSRSSSRWPGLGQLLRSKRNRQFGVLGLAAAGYAPWVKARQDQTDASVIRSSAVRY